MGIKVTKEDFEKLPDSLKAKFTAAGDEYELQEEDVEGLKKSKADILKEKKDLQDKYDELAKFKAEQEAKEQKAKQADLEAKGEYEKALKEKEKAWSDRLNEITAEKESLFADVRRERLTNELVQRGVLPDRAGYLVGELDGEIELVKDDAGKYALRKKGGIGDAAEFDSLIETAKHKTPFFFAANTASGSGASPSNGNGSGKTITRAQYDANPTAYGHQLGKGELTITD